jgi:hypothetical protein
MLRDVYRDSVLHRRLWRRTDWALLPPDLERQPGTVVGIAEVDALAVVKVDPGDSLVVDIRSIETGVVDGHPSPVIEAQRHMSARHQWMGDSDVGPQVSADDDVTTGSECASRRVGADCQRWERSLPHPPTL